MGKEKYKIVGCNNIERWENLPMVEEKVHDRRFVSNYIKYEFLNEEKSLLTVWFIYFDCVDVWLMDYFLFNNGWEWKG